VADDGKSHMLLTDFVCTIDHIETNINSQSWADDENKWVTLITDTTFGGEHIVTLGIHDASGNHWDVEDMQGITY
jgi:hypothetical protein